MGETIVFVLGLLAIGWLAGYAAAYGLRLLVVDEDLPPLSGPPLHFRGREHGVLDWLRLLLGVVDEGGDDEWFVRDGTMSALFTCPWCAAFWISFLIMLAVLLVTFLLLGDLWRPALLLLAVPAWGVCAGHSLVIYQRWKPPVPIAVEIVPGWTGLSVPESSKAIIVFPADTPEELRQQIVKATTVLAEV